VILKSYMFQLCKITIIRLHISEYMNRKLYSYSHTVDKENTTAEILSLHKMFVKITFRNHFWNL